MPITRTPIIDDSGSGQDGTVIDNAWKQQFYDQIDGALTSITTPWTNIPYNAADYTVISGSGTFTVSSWITFSFVVVNGYTALLQFYTFAGVTITGAPTTLGIHLPLTAAANSLGLHAYMLGVNGIGQMEIQSGSATLRLQRDFYGTPYQATSGGHMYGQMILQL
jgi:hypothetical protein